MINKVIIFLLLTFSALAISSVFIVKESHRAIIIQLGEVISKTPLNPGLHVKLPFIHKVVNVDSRIIDIESDSSEVIASDQKRLIVNYYAKYRIEDPVLYYESVRHESILENRLKSIIESQVREHIGSVPLKSLLTETRIKIVENIRLGSDAQAKNFGASIIDVRIKRTDLPDENSEAIFRRMQTEREKEAKEIRATGIEEAQYIKANADKEKVILLSEAHKNSQIIRGKGDAESAAILNDAFGIDNEFFEFYRSMQSYKKSFVGSNTKIVLSNRNKYLSNLFVKGY